MWNRTSKKSVEKGGISSTCKPKKLILRALPWKCMNEDPAPLPDVDPPKRSGVSRTFRILPRSSRCSQCLETQPNPSCHTTEQQDLASPGAFLSLMLSFFNLQ